MLKSYLSSPAMLDKIAFALGWVLVIIVASWPGSLAIQIAVTILCLLFVISAILCFITHGKLYSLYRELNHNRLLRCWMSIIWFAGFICAGFSDSLIREVVGNVATVILIVGLLFYPSPGVVAESDI